MLDNSLKQCNYSAMFWIALAATLAAPAPKEIWIDPVDAPLRELSSRMLYPLRLRITVAPDSHVQDCEIEQSSGDAHVDSYTCDLTRQHARFTPAHMADGTAAYGVYRVRILWTAIPPSWYDRLPDAFKPKGDLTLNVDRLPRGKGSPLAIGLAIAVDASGRPTNCGASDKKDDAKLVSLGCQQVMKAFKAVPAKSADGRSVPSVQTGTVLFSRQ